MTQTTIDPQEVKENISYAVNREEIAAVLQQYGIDPQSPGPDYAGIQKAIDTQIATIAAAADLPFTKKILPRIYQGDAYRAIAAAIRDYDGPFFVDASVGSGKTICMGLVLARARDTNMRCWVLARRGELVEQNAETFWDCGVRNSIYSASVGRKVLMPDRALVGSEGTVARSIDGELRDDVPDILMIDECHEVNFTDPDCQYMKVINELKRRNPKLRIVGFTGSPYRGTLDIVGAFWKRCVYQVGTTWLVDNGYLVPTIFGFGHDDIKYDLSEWAIPESDSHSDYSQKELQAMQRKIMKDSSTTHKIMAEVVELTADRNAVMITGAGRRHLEDIAECLPADSWVIITDQTGSKARRESLRAVSRGEKKYILQVGVLTTGYDECLIDTSVIMRKIGSLTLLVQLLGRGMRLLKKRHRQAGYIKDDHLVLDYSPTMEEMADMYHNPILEKAQLDKAKQDHDLILCPSCNTQNSKFARRCIGEDPFNTLDGRCEWFWVANKCPGCETQNDPSAEECRKCGQMLKDPNKNLANKHYTDDDWRQVYKMTMKPTSNSEGVVVEYLLHMEGEPLEGARTRRVDGTLYEVATEIFWPLSDKQWARGAWKTKFLSKHLHRSGWGHVKGKNAGQICRMSALFDVPTHVTHRINSDSKSVVHRKRFLSGRIGEG